LPQALRATLRRAAAAAARTPFRLLNFRRWHPGFETRLVRACAAKLEAPKNSSLLDAVAGWSRTQKSPVVLVLDQFEEFLLYNPDPTETEFVRHLAGIIADPDLNAHILLSLREDSIASLDTLRAVIPAVLSSPVQLRRSIAPLPNRRFADRSKPGARSASATRRRWRSTMHWSAHCSTRCARRADPA
jgi:hypothetical protein